MKRVIALGLALGLGLSVTPQQYDVEAKAGVKTFENCKQMNKVYKGGVAKVKNYKNKGGKLRYTKYLVVNKSLYLVNQSKDRDKDGLVCER